MVRANTNPRHATRVGSSARVRALAAAVLAVALPALADSDHARTRHAIHLVIAGNDVRERRGDDEQRYRMQMQLRQQEFRSLSPEQQSRLRDAARQYRSLPPDQRMQLRQRWEQMSPQDRERIRRKTEERRRSRE